MVFGWRLQCRLVRLDLDVILDVVLDAVALAWHLGSTYSYTSTCQTLSVPWRSCIRGLFLIQSDTLLGLGTFPNVRCLQHPKYKACHHQHCGSAYIVGDFPSSPPI